jgi:hypothetical protein
MEKKGLTRDFSRNCGEVAAVDVVLLLFSARRALILQECFH